MHTNLGIEQWPEKKIKLEEEAINEILVADTDLESGAEAILRKKKKKRDNNNSRSKPQQKSP
jgi:hypothetical protein